MQFRELSIRHTHEIAMNSNGNPHGKLAACLAKVDRSLTRASKAWATWRDAAKSAHLAAVMGDVLPRHLRPTQGGWSVGECISDDTDLQDQLRASSLDSDHHWALQAAIEQHIRRLLQEIDAGIAGDISSRDNNIDDLNNPAPTLQAEQEAAQAASDEANKALERLARARKELASHKATLNAFNARKGFNATRTRAVELYDEQLKYITSKANELAFCDDALGDVARRIEKKKKKWTGSGAAFFSSSSYTSLQAKRKSISGERSHIEVDLQSYFDHHAHGASRSETTKPDRQQLKLANGVVRHWKLARLRRYGASLY